MRILSIYWKHNELLYNYLVRFLFFDIIVIKMKIFFVP